MTKKYIVTGGPGSGKSAIILMLERMGEHVIREAAEDHIKLRQACGVEKPWLEKDIQDQILAIQIERELRVPKMVKRVFLDRSIVDGLAYIENNNRLSKKVIEASKKAGYEKEVFFVGLMKSVDTNKIRKENYDAARVLEKRLIEEYTKLGYKLIIIPMASVDERVKMIMACL